MFCIKTIVILVKLIAAALICRPFGSLMKDIAEKYEHLTIQDLRKWEKLTSKGKKADLDIQFLKNCKTFGVVPKFVLFPVPPQHQRDLPNIRKRLLKSAIHPRTRDRANLEKERICVSDFVRVAVVDDDFAH